MIYFHIDLFIVVWFEKWNNAPSRNNTDITLQAYIYATFVR
jgi:hypothetical protein